MHGGYGKSMGSFTFGFSVVSMEEKRDKPVRGSELTCVAIDRGMG